MLKHFTVSKFVSDEWITSIREEVIEAGSNADHVAFAKTIWWALHDGQTVNECSIMRD